MKKAYINQFFQNIKIQIQKKTLIFIYSIKKSPLIIREQSKNNNGDKTVFKLV